jgi:hypothetical protein
LKTKLVSTAWAGAMKVLRPEVLSLPDPDVDEMRMPFPPGHPIKPVDLPESGAACERAGGLWPKPTEARTATKPAEAIDRTA